MPDSLNCPNCGAPSTPDAASCEYCGSRLAAVACPSCLGSMFVGSQFCPHCGAKAVEPEQDGGATLECPGCAGEMPSLKLGTTSIHSCSTCGSTWLTPDEFAKVCAERGSLGSFAAAVGGDAGDASRLSLTAKVRYVRCCVCHKTMNRVNFGHRSGVIIDVCKGHGVWFEKDELRQVLDFIGKGGLERSNDSGISFAMSSSDRPSPSFGFSMNVTVHKVVNASSDASGSAVAAFLKSLFS